MVPAKMVIKTVTGIEITCFTVTPPGVVASITLGNSPIVAVFVRKNDGTK